MTDKFEEFLINEVEKYNNSHENVPDDWSNPVDVLSKYREFLKEQFKSVCPYCGGKGKCLYCRSTGGLK